MLVHCEAPSYRNRSNLQKISTVVATGQTNCSFLFCILKHFSVAEIVSDEIVTNFILPQGNLIYFKLKQTRGQKPRLGLIIFPLKARKQITDEKTPDKQLFVGLQLLVRTTVTITNTNTLIMYEKVVFSCFDAAETKKTKNRFIH